jgi:hypothetical protein
MSARTVVVATTFSAPGAGLAAPEDGVAAEEHPATTAITATSDAARLSLTDRRTDLTTDTGVLLLPGRGAGRAAAEQLEAVAVDAEPRPALHGPHDVADAAVVDLGRAAAALAHDVVVVGRLATDVGVLAVRQVEALDHVQLVERVQGTEDRRPADPEASVTGVGEDVGRGEGPVTFGDERGHVAASIGQAEASGVKGGKQR